MLIMLTADRTANGTMGSSPLLGSHSLLHMQRSFLEHAQLESHRADFQEMRVVALSVRLSVARLVLQEHCC